MPTKLLRFHDLKSSGLVSSRMQLSRLIERGGFPAGFKLSENTRVWESAQVESWLDSRRRQLS